MRYTVYDSQLNDDRSLQRPTRAGAQTEIPDVLCLLVA